MFSSLKYFSVLGNSLLEHSGAWHLIVLTDQEFSSEAPENLAKEIFVSLFLRQEHLIIVKISKSIEAKSKATKIYLFISLVHLCVSDGFIALQGEGLIFYLIFTISEKSQSVIHWKCNLLAIFKFVCLPRCLTD